MKSTLGRFLCGMIKPLGGSLRTFVHSEGISYISFAEEQKQLMRMRRDIELSPALLDKVPSVTDFTGIKSLNQFDRFSLSHVIDASLLDLSLSEMRRVSIARAFYTNPDLLVLDEPFDGLSLPEVKSITESLGQMEHTSVVLITHRHDPMMEKMSHVVKLGLSGIEFKGSRKDFMKSQENSFFHTKYNFPVLEEILYNLYSSKKISSAAVSLEVDTKLHGERINWQVPFNSHWRIEGTPKMLHRIARLVSARLPVMDPSHKVSILGMRIGIGSGTSIWDLRHKIGVVSSETQALFSPSIIVEEAILSGFFDTFGLFHKVNQSQIENARICAEGLGILHLLKRPFGNLSQGQQRLVIIGRAIVKAPELLILEDPCDGLDPSNGLRIMKIMSIIGRISRTTMLYFCKSDSNISLPECFSNRKIF